MANSTADTPRQSPTNRASRRAKFGALNPTLFMAYRMARPSRRCIRFVFEYGGGGEKFKAATQIAQIEAEQIDENRVFVIEPQHHDVARAAGIVAHRRRVEDAVRNRQAEADGGKRRIGFDVDIDTVVAIENAVDLVADLLLELRGAPAVGLRLAGKDQTRRDCRCGFQRLTGKKHQRSLQD